MTHTDDVAEKVADLLFEQGTKAASTVSVVVPKVVQGVSSFGAVTLGQVIDEIKKNKALKEMMGLEGEISVSQMNEIVRKFSLNSSSVLVGDADAKDYETLLNDQGVLYAKMDRQDDDCKMFVFLNRDQEKVEKATTILSAKRGQVTELNPDLYFNSLSPDKVHLVQGLSAVELELFRHYAREQGLLYTAIARKDDSMLVCDVADKEKARRALLYTGWALTGAGGARVREQIEHRIAGRTAIQIAAEEGLREMYIVAKGNPGNYVKISSEDYQLYKQNKCVSTVSRSDPDFFARCVAVCDGLKHPVVLSAGQFHENMNVDELKNAHTIDLFPFDFDDVIQMNQANRLANLVAMKKANERDSLVDMKSGLDDEHNATWGLWDPSVSYSEFASYEYISDEEEREARIYEFEHFKDAAYYSTRHHIVNDVDMNEKDLDYIIARAEEKRRRMFGTEGREQVHNSAVIAHSNDQAEASRL